MEAKSAILEAKRSRLNYDVDVGGGSVEWRSLLGYAKSPASTAGALHYLTRLSILSGCGGFRGSAIPPTPRSFVRSFVRRRLGGGSARGGYLGCRLVGGSAAAAAYHLIEARHLIKALRALIKCRTSIK